MPLLLLSRFLFGLGGSKVVHRKYIANYVDKSMWTKYNSRLIFMSFSGMCVGPLVYLGMFYYNIYNPIINDGFLLPGYLGMVIFIIYLLLVALFFRRFKTDSKKPIRRISKEMSSVDSQEGGDFKFRRSEADA